MSKLTMLNLALVAFMALLAFAPCNGADDKDMLMDKVEDSTVSPIADMAMLDEEMKTSTERPPVIEAPKQEEKPASQRHTVADFIIHPLIAFKPRNPEDDGVQAAGKQANGQQSSTTTTPSPWQIFGFNAGQGLSSQVQNIAGQVSGWLNDRIPGLVETPVRESSTTTTTTTTPRPDVVVRVQHKATTRRPLIAIDNRPNRPEFESDENDDDEDEDDNDNDNDNEEEHNSGESNNNNNNEGSNEVEQGDNNSGEEEEEEDDNSNNNNNSNNNSNKNNSNEEEDEQTEDEEVEEHSQRPNNRRRPLRNQNNRNGNGQRRRVYPQQQQQQQQQQQNNRRRLPNRRKQASPQRRRPTFVNDVVDDEEPQQDDEIDNVVHEYIDNNQFYHGGRPSTKRSQSNPNFIQRGQQQLINQIRQLTLGHTPAEVGNAIRKAQRGTAAAANNRRRQQATLYVNRNGQTIYYAPELAQLASPQFQQVYAQPIMQKPAAASVYPQPPLTVPLKRKGQPTQYITIPWSKLGISPPNNIVSITEGIQAQPLILNIPQSAINTMQAQAQGLSRPSKKKRPQLITADAVPLLAEASLMDIFKPPQIPHDRHTVTVANKPVMQSTANVTPVILASRPSSTKTSSTLLQQHIVPGTIVEKAPAMEMTNKPAAETESQEPVEESKIDKLSATNEEKQYIFVGEDNEPGIIRQVQPVYGDARYVRLSGNSQFYDVLPRRRFTVRRNGRELVQPAEMPAMGEKNEEQQIHVQIITEPEQLTSSSSSPVGEMVKVTQSESSDVKSETPVMDAVLSDPKPAILPAAVPAVVPTEITQQQPLDTMLTT